MCVCFDFVDSCWDVDWLLLLMDVWMLIFCHILIAVVDGSYLRFGWLRHGNQPKKMLPTEYFGLTKLQKLILNNKAAL